MIIEEKVKKAKEKKLDKLTKYSDSLNGRSSNMAMRQFAEQI